VQRTRSAGGSDPTEFVLVEAKATECDEREREAHGGEYRDGGGDASRSETKLLPS
jgi:hypothetical protein